MRLVEHIYHFLFPQRCNNVLKKMVDANHFKCVSNLQHMNIMVHESHDRKTYIQFSAIKKSLHFPPMILAYFSSFLHLAVGLNQQFEMFNWC